MSSRSSYTCLMRVWIICFGFKRNLVELHTCFVFHFLGGHSDDVTPVRRALSGNTCTKPSCTFLPV